MAWTATHELFFDLPRPETFQVLIEVAASIGSIEKQNAVAGTFKFKMRMGVRPFSCTVTLVPEQAGTKITLVGKSDDVWGSGAKAGIETYLEAVNARMASIPPSGGVPAFPAMGGIMQAPPFFAPPSMPVPPPAPGPGVAPTEGGYPPDLQQPAQHLPPPGYAQPAPEGSGLERPSSAEDPPGAGPQPPAQACNAAQGHGSGQEALPESPDAPKASGRKRSRSSEPAQASATEAPPTATGRRKPRSSDPDHASATEAPPTADGRKRTRSSTQKPPAAAAPAEPPVAEKQRGCGPWVLVAILGAVGWFVFAGSGRDVVDGVLNRVDPERNMVAVMVNGTEVLVTKTPKPTKTPGPTNTPVPTETPVPTDTPISTATPVNTPTPEALRTEDARRAPVEGLYNNFAAWEGENIHLWVGSPLTKRTLDDRPAYVVNDWFTGYFVVIVLAPGLDPPTGDCTSIYGVPFGTVTEKDNVLLQNVPVLEVYAITPDECSS